MKGVPRYIDALAGVGVWGYVVAVGGDGGFRSGQWMNSHPGGPSWVPEAHDILQGYI